MDPAQLGQLKTGQDGKELLQSHLCCPDNCPRLWDRIEISVKPKQTIVRTLSIKPKQAIVRAHS